ncbi:MAG: DinB family protein [Chromatiales bacterium]|jgi:uncharacterized damage-inducible protein DinB
MAVLIGCPLALLFNQNLGYPQAISRMGRLIGEPFIVTSPALLWYADFTELHRECERVDRRIESWVAELSEQDLDSIVSYVSVVDQRYRRFRVEDILHHLFHHQTHHRGQITTLISQLGEDFGAIDLRFIPRMPAIRS